MRTGAAAIAVVLIGVAIGALIWNRRLQTLTIVSLLAGVPLIGFVTYALRPAPLPRAGPFALAALISTVVAAGALISALRSPRIPLRRRAYLSLVALYSAVVGAASFLAIWSPEFGVAEIVVNLGWAVGWLPPSQRTTDAQASVEISAMRSRVFGFLADPTNWPRYWEWTDLVQVDPPPPLAEGSRVTVVVSGPDFRGQESSEKTTVTYLIDELVPDSSLEMVMLGHLDNRITWRLSGSPIGTTFATRAWGVVPYPLAIFGLMLEFWQYWRLRIARVKRTLSRLKQLLDEAAPQP
ncbi:MAG TPA: SRPBCC family protein [Candidatus Dormibacteraeota bacterium]|nr:SRPBCC family protein [Candidatus Dormibacteraeota bacterium]